jgi:hypothetical protein
VIIVVTGIDCRANTDLPQIVQALGALGSFLGPCQRRQQHGRKNGYNGDDHQQLNQSKTPSP